MRAIIGSALSLLFALGPTGAIAEEHHSTWENDDCSSERKTDEKGFVWYVHKGSDDRNDVCFGTKYMDIFYVFFGDDQVHGMAGPDQIHLGDARDIAYGGRGADTIWGGQDADQMYGGRGRDVGRDTTPRSGMDWDRFYGGPGKDYADIHDGDVMDEYYGQQGVDREPAIDHDCSTGYPCEEDHVDMGN